MKHSTFAPFALLLSILLACNTQTPAPPPTPPSAPIPAEPQAGAKSKAIGCNQLDGKQYTITLSAGGKSEKPEILSFKNKTVESSECLQYGFAAVPYTCNEALNGSLLIETVMTSSKEGRMDWKITATDTQVKGTVLWAKAGQADIAYTFEGAAK